MLYFILCFRLFLSEMVYEFPCTDVRERDKIAAASQQTDKDLNEDNGMHIMP